MCYFPIVPSKCKITRKSALKMISRAQKCPFPKSAPCPFQSWQKHCDNCITLRFLQLGEYVRHYEGILPDDACRVSVNKCTNHTTSSLFLENRRRYRSEKGDAKLHLYSHPVPIRQSLKQRQHKITRGPNLRPTGDRSSQINAEKGASVMTLATGSASYAARHI